jgi:hypothetical protein
MGLVEGVREAMAGHTRREFLDRIGLSGISAQNATRWASGDIRSKWVPLLVDALDLGREVSEDELVRRLNAAGARVTRDEVRLMATDATTERGAVVVSTLAGTLRIEWDDAARWLRQVRP